MFIFNKYLLLMIPLVNGLNDRPIIGILSQELIPGLEGARAVPIIVDSNQDFEELFQYINGLLIPGGSVSLDTSPYSRVAKLMMDLAMTSYEAGDYFPIWGTCLGFELLAFLTNDELPNLIRCQADDLALPLVPTQEFENSRVLQEADSYLLDVLANQNVTANYHYWCLTPENFLQNSMDNFWEVISTNQDEEGLEFISMMEAKNYPFYGVQFHPEKNNYEFALPKTIPHTREAVKVSNYFADFFIQEARKSNHTFPSREIERQHLIYNWPPMYSGDFPFSVFEQMYVFGNTASLFGIGLTKN